MRGGELWKIVRAASKRKTYIKVLTISSSAANCLHHSSDARAGRVRGCVAVDNPISLASCIISTGLQGRVGVAGCCHTETIIACLYRLTLPCASTEPSRFCNEHTKYAV